MELKEAIIGRRSVRKYDDKPVSDEILHDILDAAVWAPSAIDLQPWFFVVVKSKEEREKLQDLLVLTSKRMRPDLESRFQSHPKVVTDTLSFMESMGGAPVCILTFLYGTYHENVHPSAVQSVAAAMQNITLLAYDKGIGTCWTTGSLHVAEEMEKRYANGKGKYMGLIAMGYGDFPKSGPPRKSGRIEFI